MRVSRCVLLAILMATSSAAAEAPSHTLDWVRLAGAESCPSGAAMAEQVKQRLGRDPFGSAAERSIEAVVSHSDELWRVQIHVRDPAGTEIGARDLDSAAPDCGPVAAAAVLAIALTIDPNASTAATPPPPPAPEPAPPVFPPPRACPAAPPCPPPPPPAPAPEPQPHTHIGAHAALGLGLLPRTQAGVSLLSGMAYPSGFAWLAGMTLFPETRTEDSANGDFGVGLTYATAQIGYSFGPPDTATITLAGGGVAGALQTAVYSPNPNGSGDLFWFGAVASATGRARLAGSLVGELGVSAIIPRSYDLWVEGRTRPAFSPAPVALVAEIGLAIAFW